MTPSSPHPNLEDAIRLAVEAHRGQLDKCGQPYILHPLRVMLRLDGEIERIVGVLHDVLEDTRFTAEDLRRMGYSEDILAALDGVTKREGEPYEEFVLRSKANPISRRVKLADLEDNLNPRRMPGGTPRDFERMAKYRRAQSILQVEAPNPH